MAHKLSSDSKVSSVSGVASGAGGPAPRGGVSTRILVAGLGFSWALFQLWIASPLPFALGWGVFNSMETRGLHVAFALALCFFLYGARANVTWSDIALSVLGAGACAYLFVFAGDISRRAGAYSTGEIVLAGVGLAVLFVATRRALGWPLTLLALLGLVYALLGPWMPEIIRHGGVSFERLLAFQWLGENGVFGIPVGVATEFVFLFVLFGALLERAGASAFFLDLAYALVGRLRGGPAKGAILASGLTGMISGSSIANVVTTGAFTIPAMRKSGLSAEKAGAIEVAASVNGQIMPPIMGAAAFIMAGLTGVPYLAVVKAAFLPAFISYLSLFWMAHLEALKHNLRPMVRADIPVLRATLRRGGHHLIPVVILIYLLVGAQQTAATSVFYACIAVMGMMVIEALRQGTVRTVGMDMAVAFIRAACNMTAISVAVAAAGTIVGVIALTGLGGAMLQVVEALAGNSVYLLLGLTAIVCIFLGMGLPTTANYLVVASLMAPVLVELGGAAGLTFGLLAAHMYVFYFGLMADVTPPVGLAAYAAASISRGDPLKTGLQAFCYAIRTAVLPLAFIFNAQLLLMDITGWPQALTVFFVSLVAILAVSCVLQNWLYTRLRVWESALLLTGALVLLVPHLILTALFTHQQMLDVEVASLDHHGPVTLEVRRPPSKTLMSIHLSSEDTKSSNESSHEHAHGLSVFTDQDRQGRPILVVDDLVPGGRAERAGLDYGDEIVAIHQQVGTPPAHGWAYAMGLVLIGGVVFGQRRRQSTQAEALAHTK